MIVKDYKGRKAGLRLQLLERDLKIHEQAQKIQEHEQREAGQGAFISTPPRLPEAALIAVLAVAQMIENKAEMMVVRVGADVGAYKVLVEEAHNLRAGVQQFGYYTFGSVETMEAKATELYERLSK